MIKRYGPYQANGGHLFWFDVLENGQRQSVWVHRELMAKFLGRPLSKDAIIHHKDGDPTNNRIENLELTTVDEHAKHHLSKRQLPLELMVIICPECGTTATIQTRRYRHNNLIQGKAGPFCGKRCAGAWSQRRKSSGPVG